jgi:internalin A
MNEGKTERLEGMELRGFRKLLDEVDAKQEWGGLKLVLTPEGHYVWICKEHAEE